MNTVAFYTPYYWCSDVLPHLLEHYFFTYRKNNAHFFFTHWTDANGHLEDIRTEYNFDKNLTIEPILKDLQWKLDKNLWKVKKVLRDEYTSISYEEKLFERILNKVYNQKYNISHYKSVDFSELEQYQDKYYKNGSWILFDSNNSLIDYYLPNKRMIEYLETKTWNIEYKSEKYKYLATPLQNRKDILGLFLYRNFANQYQKWFNTFVKPKYYYNDIDLRFSNDYAILIIPNIIIEWENPFKKWSKNHIWPYYDYVFSDVFKYYSNEWRNRLMLIFWEFIDENIFLKALKEKFESLKMEL